MTGAPSLRLDPGSTIGILGDGQLGRMIALAAARLGYRCHVYADQADSPAAQVCAAATIADYRDHAALDTFAGAVDVVTFEFENIPVETARHLAKHVPVRPDPDVLTVSQDRLLEKRFINEIGIATAPFAAVTDLRTLTAALAKIGRPAILKTARLGYDGKGQVTIAEDTDPEEALCRIGTDYAVLEGWIDFSTEISVIVARSLTGEIASYVPVENRHVSHILDTTTAPADLSPELAARAQETSRHIAERLDLVGLVAVEMFLTRSGTLLVNEIAPRPHNSGHWTIDACATSQFEQAVRAICGLPLGGCERHADAVMKNLIGDEVHRWPELMAEPGARLHLYGKREVRPGRKMGHVTRLFPRADGVEAG